MPERQREDQIGQVEKVLKILREQNELLWAGELDKIRAELSELSEEEYKIVQKLGIIENLLNAVRERNTTKFAHFKVELWRVKEEGESKLRKELKKRHEQFLSLEEQLLNSELAKKYSAETEILRDFLKDKAN